MNTIIAIKPMLYRTPAHILKSAHDNESHFNSQSKNKPISFFFRNDSGTGYPYCSTWPRLKLNTKLDLNHRPTTTPLQKESTTKKHPHHKLLEPF